MKLKLVLDERETYLYDKCLTLLNSSNHPKSSCVTLDTLSKRVLHLGDAEILDKDDHEIVLIERKSLADLLSSIKDGRYEEQSYRLVHSSGLIPHHIIYVVEGMMSQLRSSAERRMVYSAMTSLGVFKGFSVVRTISVQETAEWLLALTDKLGRDLAKGKTIWSIVNPIPPPSLSFDLGLVDGSSVDLSGCNLTSTSLVGQGEEEQLPLPPLPPPLLNTIVDPTLALPPPPYCSVVRKVKKDNISPVNMGEIILCQIPGISSVSAVAIMQKFRSISHLIDEMRANPTCLDGMKNGTRKLSKTIIANIRAYLLYGDVAV